MTPPVTTTAPGTIKITAPAGSHFLLKWTCDGKAKVTNTFKLHDGSTKPFVHTTAVEKVPPTYPPQGVAISVTSTADGMDGFLPTIQEPKSSTRMTSGKGDYSVDFAMVFTARLKGDYTIVVDYGNGKTLTEIITVTDATALNARRQSMIDICKKWIPPGSPGTGTGPGQRHAPDGEAKDLMELSGWGANDPASWTVPNVPGYPAPIVPPVNNGWTQSGAVISAINEGNMSFAQRTYNSTGLATNQANWDEATAAKKTGLGPKPTGMPPLTSCISVMSSLFQTLWGKGAPAVHLDLKVFKVPPPQKYTVADYYVVAADALKADPTNLPNPGDVLFFAQSSGIYSFSHVCILLARSDNDWTTADGGGGQLPIQTASIADKAVTWKAGPYGAADVQLPWMSSPTDNLMKPLAGWVNLDKYPNALFPDSAPTTTP